MGWLIPMKKNSRRQKKNADSPRVKTEPAPVGQPSVTLAGALSLLFERELHPSTGRSRHTLDSYRTTFKLLLRFVEDTRSDLSATQSSVERYDTYLVEAFLRHLRQKRSCGAATINVRRAAFAAMARTLQRYHPELTPYCASILAMRSRKAPETLVGYFELHELHAIFKAVNTTKPDGFRDLTLLRCLYNTGARASELAGLRISDLRLEEPQHVVLRGKGSKSRAVPIWSATADLLRGYLKAARRCPRPEARDFTFIGRRGNALTRQGLYKIARKHIQAAAFSLPQLKREELHPVCSFRHTTATHLLMAGVSLPEIQDLLGHVRAETTMRYRTVSLDRKRHALHRLLELRELPPGRDDTHQVESAAALDQNLIDWLERL